MECFHELPCQRLSPTRTSHSMQDARAPQEYLALHPPDEAKLDTINGELLKLWCAQPVLSREADGCSTAAACMQAAGLRIQDSRGSEIMLTPSELLSQGFGMSNNAAVMVYIAGVRATFILDVRDGQSVA